MREVVLDSETDFEGWREQVRNLVSDGVSPSDVNFRVSSQMPDLLGGEEKVTGAVKPPTRFDVPRAFVDIAPIAILHRNGERFRLLYELLWRIKYENYHFPALIDPLGQYLEFMAKEVRRDEHKMHAFVRFREVRTDDEPHFVAWFEPDHHIVELATPFFVRRFPNMDWSILTPDMCVHWDTKRLSFAPGVARSSAPKEDIAEDLWRTYYQAIFNPARLKVKAMRKEMPQKYWKNLPEAVLIKPMIASAAKVTQEMLDSGPVAPRPNPQRSAAVKANAPERAATDMDALIDTASDCRMCPLWAPATQTVFGEGPSDASLMLVGEQPGDQEDLVGRPFIGPAGKMLDKALAEAGIERDKAYVTNAVKHFKFLPRGKIRLHQKPQTPEISICRSWLMREISVVKPRLIVALGGTAAHSLFGKPMTIGKSRGRILPSNLAPVIVTVHPSYLLRLPDQRAQKTEYGLFVDDLKFAKATLDDGTRAR